MKTCDNWEALLELTLTMKRQRQARAPSGQAQRACAGVCVWRARGGGGSAWESLQGRPAWVGLSRAGERRQRRPLRGCQPARFAGARSRARAWLCTTYDPTLAIGGDHEPPEVAQPAELTRAAELERATLTVGAVRGAPARAGPCAARVGGLPRHHQRWSRARGAQRRGRAAQAQASG